MAAVTGYPRYKPLVVTETAHLSEAEWLNFRRGGIGGSDVAILMGVSPYHTARDLYYDKLNIKPVIDEEDNWLQKEIGHVLEPLVAKLFEKKTGMKVIQIKKMFKHPVHQFMYADVDFFIETDDGKRGVLEIKTSHYNNLLKWKDDAIPYHYELQCRHYLAVTDLDFAYIACLFSNSESDFIYRRIDRDRAYEDVIIQTEKQYWETYIIPRVEPPYTEDGDMVLESIRKHHGGADKAADGIILTDDEIIRVDRYLELKAIKSELNEKVKSVDNEMKLIYAPIVDRLGRACLGSAKVGNKTYTIKFNPRYTDKISKDNLEKLKITAPDIYSRFVETTESRVFSADVRECAS